MTPSLALLAFAAAAAPGPLPTPEAALPRGARILKQADADLDRDGAPEKILVAGVPDPDAGATGGREVFDGTLRVHVLARAGAGWSDAGHVEMEGVLEDVVVAELGEGTDRVRLLLSAAVHCGGSCSGIELHAHALRGGRLVPLLGREGASLMKGFATVHAGRFLETWTRDDDEGVEFVECCPNAYRVVRLAPRGGELVEIDAARVLAEEMGKMGSPPRAAARLSVSTAEPGPILTKEQLAARDWLVRPGVSIGKIRLGMTAGEVHERLGAPAYGRSRSSGVVLERWGAKSRVFVWIEGGKVVQIAVTSPRFRTGDGLGPGEPVAKVLAAYPDPDRPTPAPGAIVETGGGVAFQVAGEGGGRVGAVLVHRVEAGALPVE